MKKTRRFKILSLVMALIMLFVAMPTYIFAFENETEAEINDDEQAEASIVSDNEVYVVEEDVSLREENAKHFKLSDGTMKAVSYAQAVHYKDENGNWIDIDNTLSLSGSEYTANNKTEIKFANKSGSNGLLSIKDGEYKIDFTPLNTNKVNVVIENPQKNNSRKFDDVKKLNDIVSRATYKGIYDGIDLEYILVGNNIKENIIVNDKQEEYKYSFEIKLNKLNAELKNNEIILTDSDTGEKVYEIPAPYMLDANGEYSNNVEYTLTQNSKWKYTFTVTADPEWINAEERQFPVTIDPTITVGTITKEIFVMEDGVYDNYQSLIIGNFMGFYYDVPGFIKFDTTLTTSPKTILTDVMLSLHVSYVENETGNDLKIGVFNALEYETGGEISSWYEETDEGTYSINYNNTSNFYESTPLSEQTITETGVYSWNITNWYTDWINGEITNHGFCIKGVGLPTADDTSISNKRANIRVTTSFNTDDYMIPTIEISYRYLVGVEDYYAYAENTLGDVGKSYVNLYDGSLTYINNLTSIAVSENLTYDINMVYNSIDKTWTPSFAENIEPHTALGVEQYIWTDEDGTKHLFTPYLERNQFGAYVMYEYSAVGQLWEVNNPTVFYPEDDIDYVLIQTTNNEYILRDYQGNQKMFDSEGRLSKICDAQGNMIFINNYSGGTNMASVYKKDSDGNVVILAELYYLTSRRLSHINDIQNQKKIQFSWGDVGAVNIFYKNLNGTIQYRQVCFEYNDPYETDLACVLDKSINQKIMYYIDTKDDEDASNDEKVIEIINVNSTPDQTIKKYVVDYGFCKDLGADFTSNTNDDLLTTFTFDGKGRNASLTYDDSLFPDSSYYSMEYNQNILSNGINLVKYNLETGSKEFLILNEQVTSFDFSNVTTTNSGVTYKIIENTKVAPYNMVCKIKVYYDESSTPSYVSTGFLTGTNTLIMSAHGLLKPKEGDDICRWEFPTKVEVIPGCYIENDEEQTPFGTYEITEFYIQREYYYFSDINSSEKYQYDWAACVIDENVDDKLGHFSLMIPNDDLIDETIQVLGYREISYEQNSNEHMYYTRGKIQSNQETIKYNALTAGGMSGGPVFLYDTNCLIGVHVGGGTEGIIGCAKKIDNLIYTLVNNLNSIE